MTDAQHAVPREGLEREVEPREQGQRAFGADQEVGHVHRHSAETVQVVASDVSEHPWPSSLDLIGLARVESAHPTDEIRASRGGIRCGGGHRRPVDGSESHLAAVRQHCIDGPDVVDHEAIADRPRAGRVVACHAAQRCLRARGHVHGEPETVRAKSAVQLVEHHAWPDGDRAVRRVEVLDLGQVLAGVEDQALPDGLAALRRARAAWNDRNAGVCCYLDGTNDVRKVTGNDHADRLDLVHRRIGAVAPAVEGVEHRFALRPRAGGAARDPDRQPRTRSPRPGPGVRPLGRRSTPGHHQRSSSVQQRRPPHRTGRAPPTPRRDGTRDHRGDTTVARPRRAGA